MRCGGQQRSQLTAQLKLSTNAEVATSPAGRGQRQPLVHLHQEQGDKRQLAALKIVEDNPAIPRTAEER